MDYTKHFPLLQVQGTPTGPSVNPSQQREVSGLVSAFTTNQSRGKDPPADVEGVGCSRKSCALGYDGVLRRDDKTVKNYVPRWSQHVWCLVAGPAAWSLRAN